LAPSYISLHSLLRTSPHDERKHIEDKFNVIKMNRNTRDIIAYIYYTFCVAATIGMTIYCLIQYLLDKDVSDVNFRTFDSDKDYVYPTITLCFETTFLEEALFNEEKGINEYLYTQFLSGEYWQENLLAVDYDNVTIKIEDYFLGIYISRFYSFESGFVEYLYNAHNIDVRSPREVGRSGDLVWRSFAPRFYTSFRDVLEKCVSFDIPSDLGQHVYRFELLFNSSIFPGGIRPEDSLFGVKIHYPNQFLSNNVKKYSWKKREDMNHYTMLFKLHNIIVINMRNKPKEPCNENWKNDDENKMRNIMNNVGCRPPHWKELNGLPNCSNNEQMAKFYYLDLQDQFPPCIRIQKVVYGYEELDYIAQSWAKSSEISAERYFKVAVEFDDSSFMEIKHVRAFDVQSLIGNSGGYLGLFTGYALWQIPHLINFTIQKI
jgi:hypothetical protein